MVRQEQFFLPYVIVYDAIPSSNTIDFRRLVNIEINIQKERPRKLDTNVSI